MGALLAGAAGAGAPGFQSQGFARGLRDLRRDVVRAARALHPARAGGGGGHRTLLKSLGRYAVRGVLGQGAMGVVYDAHDPKLERRVAIKTVLAPNLKQRFEREVRAAARLNHPNIVQVYDFGAEGDLAYIVMEHVEGRELKHYFDAQERFDLETVLGLMRDLLEALHFAHEAGIIHRDVKPANVMVAGARAKLMDFGVAHYTDPEGKELEATRAGTLVGTP